MQKIFNILILLLIGPLTAHAMKKHYYPIGRRKISQKIPLRVIDNNLINQVQNKISTLLPSEAIEYNKIKKSLEILKGKSINDKDHLGRTRLHYAASLNADKEAQQLIDSGANVNIQDDFFRTPLHYATLINSLKLVNLLLENDANPEIVDENTKKPIQLATSQDIINILSIKKDKNGNTSLHRAVQKENTKKVKNLIQKGINLNITNKQHKTALHIASQKNYKDIIQLLLQYNANPNIQDNEGNTPLHYYICKVQGKDYSILDLFFAKGANQYIQNNQGFDIYKKASFCNNTATARLWYHKSKES